MTVCIYNAKHLACITWPKEAWPFTMAGVALQAIKHLFYLFSTPVILNGQASCGHVMHASAWQRVTFWMVAVFWGYMIMIHNVFDSFGQKIFLNEWICTYNCCICLKTASHVDASTYDCNDYDRISGPNCGYKLMTTYKL